MQRDNDFSLQITQKYQKISNQTRLQIIQQVFCNQQTRYSVAQELKLKYPTVKKICKQYETFKQIAQKARGGANRQKSTVEMINYIIEQRSSNLSFPEIQLRVLQKFETEFSISEIKYLNKTYRKVDINNVGVQCDLGLYELYITVGTQWDQDCSSYCDIGCETKDCNDDQ